MIFSPFFVRQGLSMPATLNATWGADDANSYVSLAEAETIISEHFMNSTAWATLSEDKKTGAILESTRAIHSFQYAGEKEDTNQSMAFPRSVALTDDEQQDLLKHAVCEQALHLARLGGVDEHALRRAAGLKSATERIGPLTDSYEYRGGGSVLAPEVKWALRPFFATPRVERG